MLWLPWQRPPLRSPILMFEEACRLRYGAHLSLALCETFELTSAHSRSSQIFAAVCSLYPTTRLVKSQRIVFEASMLALAASAPEASDGADENDWFGPVHLACDRVEATAHQAAGAALYRISGSYDCASALTRYSLQIAF